jgi:hypothetical protein
MFYAFVASTPVLNSQWHQEERTSSLSAISPIKMNTSRTPMQNGTATDSTVSASQSQKQLDMALIASQSGRDDTMTVPLAKTNSSAALAANSDNREVTSSLMCNSTLLQTCCVRVAYCCVSNCYLSSDRTCIAFSFQITGVRVRCRSS